MQLDFLHAEFDKLQSRYGDPRLSPIYGAGATRKANVMLVFMNPTGRNIASAKVWRGLRAPWLGTKSVWPMFERLGLISRGTFSLTQTLRPEQWTPSFSFRLYSELRKNGVYVTNLAKCTQADARPLNNSIYREYLRLMREEMEAVEPKSVVLFGNQVSSIILGRAVSVSDYAGAKGETISPDKKVFRVYPTYYPVGQGRRNMPLAIRRIKRILG